MKNIKTRPDGTMDLLPELLDGMEVGGNLFGIPAMNYGKWEPKRGDDGVLTLEKIERALLETERRQKTARLPTFGEIMGMLWRPPLNGMGDEG